MRFFKMIKSADKMREVHSDIRGPLFYEALDIEKRGGKVLKLNTGNPASFGFKMPKSVIRAITSNVESALGYCDFRGMPEARGAIAAYHINQGFKDIGEDDVFIGNGVSEVVSFALDALLNAGDEVLLPCPCYPLWSNCTRIAGGAPVFYKLNEENGWQPDVDDIRSKITDKTRAIVIINPNNPTGAVYSKETLLEIIGIAREREILIFSDEIYDRLLLDGRVHYPIAALAPDIPVITMNGLSKSHCLCGFRVGWMVISGPKTATEKYRESIVKLTSLRLCANAPAQLVIKAALEDGEYPANMARDGGAMYERRHATTETLSKYDGISFVENGAAFYLFPKIDIKKHNIKSDKKFASDLLRATNILVVPASGFEMDSQDHFRIVMLPSPDELSTAMDKIGKFLESYVQE